MPFYDAFCEGFWPNAAIDAPSSIFREQLDLSWPFVGVAFVFWPQPLLHSPHSSKPSRQHGDVWSFDVSWPYAPVPYCDESSYGVAFDGLCGEPCLRQS